MDFLRAATLGRGSIPVLPDDVRRHIWSYAHVPLLWCSTCTVPIVVEGRDGLEVLLPTASPARMWVETPRCRACSGHPYPDGAVVVT